MGGTALKRIKSDRLPVKGSFLVRTSLLYSKEVSLSTIPKNPELSILGSLSWLRRRSMIDNSVPLGQTQGGFKCLS